MLAVAICKIHWYLLIDNLFISRWNEYKKGIINLVIVLCVLIISTMYNLMYVIMYHK